MHAAVLSAQRHFYRLAGGASEGAACFERLGYRGLGALQMWERPGPLI